MNQLPDTALLLRLQNADDKEAFDELYRRHRQKLYAAAFAKLQNEEDAKDCLQEVFVSLWHKRHEIDIKTSIDAYLYIALKYRVLNMLRSRSIYGHHLDIFASLPASTIPATDERLQLEALQKQIRAAIRELPDKMREVYLLSRQQDLSLTDIANQLGLSVQTVKNQLGYAVRRIRARLSGNA